MKLCKLLLLTSFTTLSLIAQPSYTEQVLASSGGDAVSIDREWAVVGDAANNAVHIYKLDYSNFQWTGWNAPLAPKQGGFGGSVAVHGDKMVVGAPNIETWRMEANTITIDDTYKNPIFTTITLQRTYEQPPLIFALASTDGGNPSAVKIKNRTNNSFEIVHAEPLNQDGPHIAMNISYIAIERGDHFLPDGTRIYAGEISTTKTIYKNSLPNPGDTKGWETISFPFPFTVQPMALAQIQTMNNELNNVPSQASEPWLTASVDNVSTDSVDLSLERSEVITSNAVTQNETIAYLVMDAKTGSFTDINSNAVDFESIYTGVTIHGWDNGCVTTNYTQTFVNTPLAVATKNTRIGGDGGWFRRCSQSSTSLGLMVDEDTYTDSERGHTKERAGILAVSRPFQAIFKQGEAYLYEYNTATTDWDLKDTIEPTVFSDDMQYGSAVAIYNNNDGTAEIAVGAPAASNSGGDTGKVFAYTYNGTQSVINTVLSGVADNAKHYGDVLDIKGNSLGKHLIVGSLYEQTTPTANDKVGAAYIYNFDGTSWGNEKHILGAIAGENLGTKVSINSDGNVSLIASLSTSYRYMYNGSTWDLNLSVASQSGGGVDIDDGIDLITKRDDQLSFYSELNSSTLLDITGGDAFLAQKSSVSLYKAQAIVNDPAITQAIALDVPCGIKPTHLIADVWAIVSAPCNTNSATIDEIFGVDLGIYGDNNNWVMYKQDTNYDGTSASMVLMASTETMSVGKSYWMITNANNDAFVDESAPGTVRTFTPLSRAGYSNVQWSDPIALFSDTNGSKIMIGNPYPRTISFGAIYYESTTQTGLLNTTNITEVNNIAYVYNPSSTSGQPYDAVSAAGTPGFLTTIKPYQGFFIRLEQNVTNPTFSFPFEK